MAKAGSLVFILALATPVVAAAQERDPTPSPIRRALHQLNLQLAQRCKTNDAEDVVVCGRSKRAYRIDPEVLAASRAADSQPPKPPIETATTDRCVGPHCGGATIPLVRMALAAAKAAALAAQGDDWREAFRTHPDQYQIYEQSKGDNQRSGQ